jgi:hypothetical protein
MDWGGGRGLGCGTFREGEEELVMVVGSLLLLRKREEGIDELCKGEGTGRGRRPRAQQSSPLLSFLLGWMLYFLYFLSPFLVHKLTSMFKLRWICMS